MYNESGSGVAARQDFAARNFHDELWTGRKHVGNVVGVREIRAPRPEYFEFRGLTSSTRFKILGG